MKRNVSKILILVVALAMIMASFTACLDELLGNKKQDSKGTCTVVLAASETNVKEYKVDLDKVEVTEGLFSVVDFLKKEGELDYEAADYG